MIGWMRTDYYFIDRCKVFLLSRNDMMNHAITIASEDPFALRDQAMAAVLIFRPDLIDASIIGIKYNFSTRCWEIQVMHDSFPAVQCGDYFDIVHLIPPDYPIPSIVGGP